MHVKILGSGCTKCEFLQENTEKALKSLNKDYTIEKVKDKDAIMDLGVMHTPALIINDTLVMAGQIASSEKIAKLIEKMRL
jgi:small redox-active disulfide protein 2